MTMDMNGGINIKLDVELVADKKDSSILLLSIGYGNSHLVAQVGSEKVIDDILAFIAEHREDKALHWIEIGHFASCPVTLGLNENMISLIIDSNVSADGFGQSAGIYIPKESLDEFIAALKEARSKSLNARS